MSKIRKIIPACDVPLNRLEDIVESTHDLDIIGGYKIGISYLAVGILSAVNIIRRHTDKPIIYDHQKAGTDIPYTSEIFMDVMVDAGISHVIIFPQAGPFTQFSWTKAAQERGLIPIVGVSMTHPGYLSNDNAELHLKFLNIKKEDCAGYIRSDAVYSIMEIAREMGVNNFVVPGNKPDLILDYKNYILSSGMEDFTFWSPGLIVQGGSPGLASVSAGQNWNMIIGRKLYNSADIRKEIISISKLV